MLINFVSIGAWDWVISIIMFIVALAVLITIHELGHFSMAKLFNVYCQEFSIGFGPKLLKKRRKGGETYFSIRAIPLGGYVSMYGEEAELEDGVNVPEERSLEGIKKWKKSIILVAGITLNLVLGYVFIFVSDVCFPEVYLTNNLTIAENSPAMASGMHGENNFVYFYGSEISEEGNPQAIPIINSFNDDLNGYYGYVIDPNIVYNDAHYVMMYVPLGNRNEPVFSQSVYLFQGSEVPDENAFAKFIEAGYTLPYYPDFTKEYLHPQADLKIDFTLLTFAQNNEKNSYQLSLNAVSDNNGETYYWQDLGLTFINEKVWAPFGERLKNTFVDYGNASVAIIKGIGMLFTGQGEVSGIIGIMTQSATIYSSYTFASYFYFWAVISINLAIFNLLPFPGLDGWALLVTIVEGISHKKIPNKVKNVVSAVGMIILFGFMLVVIVLDILRAIGIM